jgi:hypothetical protein
MTTPLRVLAALALYASLWAVARTLRPAIAAHERKTFWVLWGTWGPLVFLANYLLYRAGVMSFLPWVNNLLHTLVWIGLVLAWLYLAVRGQPLLLQCLLFATFSVIVKVFEQVLFGTWEHGHFFGIPGNTAYVLGWSLADGTYPVLSRWGLRLLGRWIPGLVT